MAKHSSDSVHQIREPWARLSVLILMLDCMASFTGIPAFNYTDRDFDQALRHEIKVFSVVLLVNDQVE